MLIRKKMTGLGGCVIIKKENNMVELGKELSFLIDSVHAVVLEDDTNEEAHRALESLMKSAAIAGFKLVQGMDHDNS